jgi:hypothetical protein
MHSVIAYSAVGTILNTAFVVTMLWAARRHDAALASHNTEAPQT